MEDIRALLDQLLPRYQQLDLTDGAALRTQQLVILLDVQAREVEASQRAVPAGLQE